MTPFVPIEDLRRFLCYELGHLMDDCPYYPPEALIYDDALNIVEPPLVHVPRPQVPHVF